MATPTTHPPSVIVVMGATGTGKTSFVNHVADEDLAVGHDLRSCTSVVQYGCCMADNRRVVIIDTPGMDDTTRSDVEILGEIAASLKLMFFLDRPIAGVIYMHRITEIRMTGSARKHLRLLRNLCGASTLGNVVLCTTMWDLEDPEIAEARLRELRDEDDFWKPLIDGGAAIARYDGTSESAWGIVASVIARNSSATLQVQDEVCVQRLPLSETAAGKEVQADIEELLEKHRHDIDRLREEMKTAYAADMKDIRDELAKEAEIKRSLEARLQSLQATGMPADKGFGQFFRENGADILRFAMAGLGLWQSARPTAIPNSGGSSRGARPGARPVGRPRKEKK